MNQVVRIRTICLVALVSCGSPAQPPPAEKPIELPPLVALVPAAGLDSLVDARPRELLAHPELLPLVTQVIPESQLRTFANRHAGVDPLKLEELTVASYDTSTLYLASGDFDGARVEQAFRERTLAVTGRFIDKPGGPLSSITRFEGDAAGDHVAMATFGRRAVAIESHAVPNRVGPLRVSELFAKCEDYLEWGVESTWIIDPESRRAWEYCKDNLPTEIAANGSLTAGEISIPLADVFAVL